MKLPTFLIVGAAKCGTTSLYEYLRQHPEVFMPRRKEPNFFAGPSHGNRTTEAEYRALFADATSAKAVGEASVAYLYDPGSPRRIFEYLGPETRIVIMLRNPVDMVHALWGHMVRAGGEKLSFPARGRGRPDAGRDVPGSAGFTTTRTPTARVTRHR